MSDTPRDETGPDVSYLSAVLPAVRTTRAEGCGRAAGLVELIHLTTGVVLTC